MTFLDVIRQGKKKDLRGADLRGAHLEGAGLYYFNCGVHIAYYTTADRMLRIGCEYHPIGEWVQDYVAIGNDHNYSPIQIDAYGAIIKALEGLR